MTHLEHMTCSVDCDVCNSSVWRTSRLFPWFQY